ncbi:MAG: hypothetical protein ACOC33_01815 [bacterium]
MLRVKDPIVCMNGNCNKKHYYLHDFLSLCFRKNYIWAHCGDCGCNNFNRTINEKDIFFEEKQKGE